MRTVIFLDGLILEAILAGLETAVFIRVAGHVAVCCCEWVFGATFNASVVEVASGLPKIFGKQKDLKAFVKTNDSSLVAFLESESGALNAQEHIASVCEVVLTGALREASGRLFHDAGVTGRNIWTYIAKFQSVQTALNSDNADPIAQSLVPKLVPFLFDQFLKQREVLDAFQRDMIEVHFANRRDLQFIVGTIPGLATKDDIYSISSKLDELLAQRNVEQATSRALADVIEGLEETLAGEREHSGLLKDMLEKFIEDIGEASTPPFLWPAILRDIASEVGNLRWELESRSNLPAEFDVSRKKALDAINAGDFQTAEDEISKNVLRAKQRYEEHTQAAQEMGTEYAKSLSQLGSLAFARLDYADARDRYLEALQIDGLGRDIRVRYQRSATISYSALINRAPNPETAQSLLDEMLEQGLTPNEITYNTLVNRSEDYATAKGWFDRMVREGLIPNRFSDASWRYKMKHRGTSLSACKQGFLPISAVSFRPL